MKSIFRDLTVAVAWFGGIVAFLELCKAIISLW